MGWASLWLKLSDLGGCRLADYGEKRCMLGV